MLWKFPGTVRKPAGGPSGAPTAPPAPHASQAAAAAAAAADGGSRKRKSASPPKKDPLTKTLEAIVHNLSENDTNGWFSKPVDTSEVPDYLTVIKCGRRWQPCPLSFF